MKSVNEECIHYKKNYEDCFNMWFSELFLKGANDDHFCLPFLGVYKRCVRSAIKDRNLVVVRRHYETYLNNIKV